MKSSEGTLLTMPPLMEGDSGEEHGLLGSSILIVEFPSPRNYYELPP